jgi:outer membrane lipoprotein-sorting protein
VIFLLVALLGLSPAVPDPLSAARAFESRYGSAATLRVTFLERYIENGKLVRADAGVASFRRPGRMRWEYQSPEENLFLVDGKWAWFYVPADHSVTRVPAKQSSDWRTPIALLTDHPKLSKVCSKVARATTTRPEKPENSVLFCLMRGSKVSAAKDANAKAESASSRAVESLEARAALEGDAVFLEIDARTGVLERVVATQPGGITIEFKFGNWQFDPPLPEALFHFDLPPNTAIVNGELPTRENSVNP